MVIETSGLADPGPIALDLLDAPELASLFRLDGIVCVADALQGLRELKAAGSARSRSPSRTVWS